MRRSFLAFAVLVASERPAGTCDCPPLDEAAALAKHALVFDGWVLEAPQSWYCAQPPAPAAAKRLHPDPVVRRDDCKATGDLLGLQTPDGRPVAVTATSVEADATTFCGVAPGRYVLATSPAVGRPRGRHARSWAHDRRRVLPGGGSPARAGLGCAPPVPLPAATAPLRRALREVAVRLRRATRPLDSVRQPGV